MLSIRQAMADYAMENRRQFLHDRTQTIGGSEIGQCARKVWYAKHEGEEFAVEKDPERDDAWGAQVRGQLIEDHIWEPAMRRLAERNGWTLAFSGTAQRTLSSGFLSSTPDGLLIGLPSDALGDRGIADIGDCLVVECKSIDPRVDLKEPKNEHVFQVHTQIGLIRECTNHKPEYGLISYTNASFLDDIDEFVIRFDPFVYETAKRRARDILTAHSAAHMTPEGWISRAKECATCPFKVACSQERYGYVPAEAASIDPDEAETIAEMARQTRAIASDIDALEIDKRRLEQTIKDRMAALNTRRVAHGDVSVAWSAVKGRPSWDMAGIRAAAEAAGVDLAPYNTVGEPSDRLTIKTS